jgi:hypothetical protein
VQNVVKAGSEVRLTITLTNTADHEIFVRREKRLDLGELSYTIDVRNDKGKTAPESQYQLALKGEPSAGTTVVVSAPGLFPVKPGATLEEAVVLNKLFDLTLPGKYLVQAKRIDDTTKLLVKSNTITVTVTR